MATAYVRLVADLEHRVGIEVGRSEDTAPPVVFEAATEDVDTGGGERRHDGVAIEADVGTAAPGEADRLRPVDDLVGLRGQPHRHGRGSTAFVDVISLVIVLLPTSMKRLHPWTWNHRSVCAPARFSRSYR